ncbi:MAG: type II toxin-antitoxin system HicA family toxin [Chloroflexota bacterium]|nr:type II toxin-antitoxin system HicA family toxin [Chloroflexota bacterium]
MARLRVLSGRQIIRILERQGFVFERQRGSHVTMRRRAESGQQSVTVPLHRAVKRKTLMRIINRSGLPRDLFE